ncbi:MAG: flagellar hook-basal body complex protein [Sulfurospirillaceae bacterium]|nr:flagellar hook-basal body complex protein [Sulfurospirillaceae bacterium]
MNTSFYNGVSGIKTSQFGLDVWAENISNVNSSGYKSASPEFATLFSTTLSDSYFEGTINNKGLGSRPLATTTNLQQGILVDTDSTFDMALSGEGWFGVTDSNRDIFYTRNGAFTKDANGDLIDSFGNYLLGTSGGNISGNTIAFLESIPLSTPSAQNIINLPDELTLPPEPTDRLSYKANLNPEVIVDYADIMLDTSAYTPTIDTLNKKATVSGDISNTLNIQNPLEGDVVLLTFTDQNGRSVDTGTRIDATFNWSVTDFDISALDMTGPITTQAVLRTEQEIQNVEHFATGVISPEGDRDILDMVFTKRVPQPTSGTIWDAVLNVTDTDGNILSTATGVVSFNTDGSLLSNTLTAIDNGGVSIALNFGTPYDPATPNSGYDGLSSLTNVETINVADSNGYVAGNLKNYEVDAAGQVQAVFDNGRNVPVAKVGIYHFRNDGGLERVGSSMFRQSSNSGEAIFYTGPAGEIINGATIVNRRLEGSNVDLATALTELIIMQKAFDASAKSITTSDQMIQNAINMKK